MTKRRQAAAYREESRFFYAALFIFFTVFGTYAYLVSTSIADVVMRKEVEQRIATLATSISELESEYIELQHSVSNDIASQHGFVAANTKVFIDRTPGTLVLSSN